MPLSYRWMSQLRPCIWYSRMVPFLMQLGCESSLHAHGVWHCCPTGYRAGAGRLFRCREQHRAQLYCTAREGPGPLMAGYHRASKAATLYRLSVGPAVSLDIHAGCQLRLEVATLISTAPCRCGVYTTAIKQPQQLACCHWVPVTEHYPVQTWTPAVPGPACSLHKTRACMV